MFKNKFNIGDIVYTKKVGNPVKGVICDIKSGFYYSLTRLVPDKKAYIDKENNCLCIYSDHPWSVHNPNWLDYPVYVLFNANGDRPTSYEEFCRHFKVAKDDSTVSMYEKMVPIVYYIEHPEFDLELEGENDVGEV